MNYSDYAIAKLNGYKKLGWKTSEVVTTEKHVSYTTVDLSGVTRKHLFSENEIKVEIVANEPVVAPVIEVATSESTVAEETLSVEVATEAPKKKIRKSKKSEA